MHRVDARRQFDHRILTPRHVDLTRASMPSRRTDSGNRSSCVKTMTWRSLRDLLEDTRESVDAGGIHGLDGIVDDDEAERALGERRARQEQTQRHRVQLALAHDAECRARRRRRW